MSTSTGVAGRTTKTNPDQPSVFSLSNLTFSDLDKDVSWAHLAPAGTFGRTAGGNAPSPVAGWLWLGGIVQSGAWHSEYRLSDDGTHDNFAFTQDPVQDPTANPDGSYTDEGGVKLRDEGRFCLWCQEIVTIRILEKTGLLAAPGDPADQTALGKAWFDRWSSELRQNYYDVFGVQQQIIDNESAYAAMTPGRNSEPLWQSDLYHVPRESTPQLSGNARSLDDGETYLLLGYTAIP